MKLTIESTERIVELNGVPARIWEGTSEAGVKVQCFVTRIAVRADEKAEALQQFERELKETRPPSVEAQSWPLRMIL